MIELVVVTINDLYIYRVLYNLLFLIHVIFFHYFFFKFKNIIHKLSFLEYFVP